MYLTDTLVHSLSITKGLPSFLLRSSLGVLVTEDIPERTRGSTVSGKPVETNKIHTEKVGTEDTGVYSHNVDQP